LVDKRPVKIVLWEEGDTYYEQVGLDGRMAHGISILPWRHDGMHLPLSLVSSNSYTLLVAHVSNLGVGSHTPKHFFCLLSWVILEFQRAGLVSYLLSFFVKSTKRKKKEKICPVAIHQEGIERVAWGPSAPFIVLLADFI